MMAINVLFLTVVTGEYDNEYSEGTETEYIVEKVRQLNAIFFE